MFFVYIALHESLIVIADITDPAKFLPFWEFKKYIYFFNSCTWAKTSTKTTQRLEHNAAKKRNIFSSLIL